MIDKSKLISEVLFIAKKAGIKGVMPVELRHGGNLIIHLSPHPIVARIAIMASQDNAEYASYRLARELRAARHLQSKGVPALLPTDDPDAGPYEIDGIWFTFWTYVPPTALPPLYPNEAIERVRSLSLALHDFEDGLPTLGVWERACQSVARLTQHDDPRISILLHEFTRIDQWMRHKTRRLIPCHGDAHPGNLLPSPDGWLWTDFEDLSLMPAYWDLTSYVGNLALFHGMKEPIFSYILSQISQRHDLEAFGMTMIARVLMSTLGNLDFALAGKGDLAFATKQLERAEDVIRQFDLMMQDYSRFV